MKKFPDGFLWGASTSSMQVEGGIENNDWAEAARLGKTPPMGLACDHYNRFEEDLDIVQSLHHNAFRFSIEWARIEPKEGVFDEKELAHYRDVVRACRVRGLEPFVCIWHFSLPLWFVQRGSFGKKDSPDIFARYAKKVAETLGDEVKFYLTINEPLVWVGEHGKILGGTPGFSPNPFLGLHYLHQLIRAHKSAYAVIKSLNPHAHVGVAKHNFSFVGVGFLGNIVAGVSQYLWNRYFLNALIGYQDFIGIQFYQRLFFWQSKTEEQAAPKSDIGWQLHPEGIYDVLKEASRYTLPIYITESGVADAKDQFRREFIVESLRAVHRAIDDGVDVRGYLHWSLLDNYEFQHGFSMKFGLVHVDHEQGQKRTVRSSAQAYADIVKDNSRLRT
ncbi:MAG: family 1 glycosylhydrolase [Patescibacteria group bacterium]